jgi:hypothetical protein
MGEIEIMTDDDAKDIAQAIEKIINRKKIHISVDKAKRIVATLKMMEACGLDLNVEIPESYANPSTVAMVNSQFRPTQISQIQAIKAGLKKRGIP